MPIIHASIMLQIVAGPKLLKLDLTNPKDQAFYVNLQKLLVLCFVVFASFTYTRGFYLPNQDIADLIGVSLRFISFLLFLQVFVGGMLIYYMEEVVSRWGIGSGVGLFIVAGVSEQLITGLFNGVHDQSGWAIGGIPRGIELIGQGQGIAQGIAENDMVILFQHHLIALITTIAVFFSLIYLMSARIELKIQNRSKRAGYRCKIRIPVTFVHFTYAIAVPLVFLNLGRILPGVIQSLGRLLYSHGITVLGTYDGNIPVSGLMYYLDPIYSSWDWYPPLVYSTYPNVAYWQIAARIVIGLLIVVIGSMISAFIWVKLTPGTEMRDIRRLIRNSGRSIRSYRRSEKAIKRAVDRYTLKIAMLSSAILGALLVIGNILGTVGAVGAGYLILAVGICLRNLRRPRCGCL
ncbi:MAG: preprotein translocase subunit SecY [Methanomicrobia archaeon]|nr:preprotein translocase subunit SecY [Methanomicrobia archaeon]